MFDSTAASGAKVSADVVQIAQIQGLFQPCKPEMWSSFLSYKVSTMSSVADENGLPEAFSADSYAYPTQLLLSIMRSPFVHGGP